MVAAPREHAADDGLGVARAGNAPHRARRIGAAPDERRVADAPGQLPRNASGGGGGGDQPAPIQRHRAHRARLDALQASPLTLGDELGRIAEGHAELAGPRPRPLTDEEGSAPAPPWTMSAGTRLVTAGCLRLASWA